LAFSCPIITPDNLLINVLGLEEKINTFAQGMGTLETRLTTAQQRASEAETKGNYKPE
jgi:hypothetical protein